MERRWFTLSGGRFLKWIKAVGIPVGVIAIFGFLVMFYGAEIESFDVHCTVEPDHPYYVSQFGELEYGQICTVPIRVKVPDVTVDIYNKDKLELEFAPNVSWSQLFIKDGRCRSNSTTPHYGYCPLNLSEKRRSDKQYNFRFAANKDYYFYVDVLKEDVDDVLKWTMWAQDGELDPFVYSPHIKDAVVYKDHIKFDFKRNITDTRETWAAVDVILYESIDGDWLRRDQNLLVQYEENKYKINNSVFVGAPRTYAFAYNSSYKHTWNGNNLLIETDNPDYAILIDNDQLIEDVLYFNLGEVEGLPATIFMADKSFDPSLEIVFIGDVDLIDWQTNKTEDSGLGLRLDAPIINMEFTNPNESTYIQDEGIYNVNGILQGALNYNANGGYTGGYYDGFGSGNYIGIGDSTYGNLQNEERTFIYWINTTDTAFKMFSGSRTGAAGAYWYFSVDASGYLYFKTGVPTSVRDTVAINNGEWHMVAFTHSSTDGIEVYRDGVNIGSIATPCISNCNGGLFSLGQAGTWDGYHWTGGISNFVKFDRVLTGEEIAYINNTAPTVGKYFKEGSFTSMVFYNATSTYWNVTQSIADSNGTALTNISCQADETCVAYWPLDGDYIDQKGSNDGTAMGTNNATGISSGAVYFDGTDDGVALGNAPASLGSSGEGAMSMWIQSNDAGSGSGFYQAPLIIATSNSWVVYTNRYSSGTVTFIFDGSSGTGAESESIVVDDTWHHILGTNNGTHTLTYVDGVLDDTFVETIKDPSASASYMGYTGATYYYNGSLDETMIYDRHLTQAEVTEIYKAGLSQHANANVSLETRTATSYNISDANLLSLWAFNADNNGTDETGNNNGSCSNCPAWSEGNGTVGGGYYFDGVNDLILISDIEDEVGIGDVTIANWVYLDTNSESGAFIKIGATPNGYGLGVGASTWENNGNNLIALFELKRWIDTGVDIGIGWHHTAMTLHSDGMPELFIDGVSLGNFSGVDALNPTGSSYIGGYLAPNRNFEGGLDEVKVYNRTMTEAEIKNLYEIGNYHIEWNNWQDEGVKQDGVPVTSTGQGKFMQLRDKFISSVTTVSAYILNYTIGIGPEPPPVDTCTYSSGNWEVDCSDDCSITSNVDVGGNNISITGTGTFTTTANISNFIELFIEGTDASNRCEVTCLSGGCFKT